MKMIAVKYAVNTDLVVEIIPADSYEEAYHILKAENTCFQILNSWEV